MVTDLVNLFFAERYNEIVLTPGRNIQNRDAVIAHIADNPAHLIRKFEIRVVLI